MQRETTMYPAPTGPAGRCSTARDARARPIPRVDRGRPPERNAIQRETGARAAPSDPAYRRPAATDAWARPIPHAARGRKPPERNAIQRGTAATSSRTRPDRRPRLRHGPLATWPRWRVRPHAAARLHATRPRQPAHGAPPPTPNARDNHHTPHRSRMTPVTGASISPTHVPARPHGAPPTDH
jgi:hypothetical protein